MKFKEVFVILLVFCCIFVEGKVVREKCGRKFDASGLSFGGNEALSNEWPWLVAFVYWPKNSFFCGGSLISSKLVISAAHCFRNKWSSEMLSREYVTVFVGKHNLSVTDEAGSSAHSVWEIILHPDWDSESVEFDADISIVVLRDPVEFSRNVEPICLPEPSFDEVVGTGTVVGWGRSERSEIIGEQFDSTPNELEITAVNQTHCFFTVRKLFIPSSPRTFCAGFVNQSKSACAGDSGGGFYLLDSSTKSFNLGGIVSASKKDRNHPGRGCDVNAYSIYTNVAKFVDWIKREIEKSKEIEWKYVEFNCNLTVYWFGPSWICSHKHQSPMTQNLKIRPKFSNYTTSVSADDIKWLEINFAPSTHIFSGLGETFSKLKQLIIINQSIKFVERSDFSSLTHLEYLVLFGNQIEFLPEDVFWDLPNLSTLYLFDNKIKKLPVNIFKTLRKIETIDLFKNEIEYLPENNFFNNLKLIVVNAHDNPLKIIAALKDLSYLELQNANCINFNATNAFQVQEAQLLINQNCTKTTQKEPWKAIPLPVFQLVG